MSQFLATFEEFPPRQRAASFGIDQAVERLPRRQLLPALPARRPPPAGRGPQMIDTGMSHIGFRCAAPLTVPPAAPPARN